MNYEQLKGKFKKYLKNFRIFLHKMQYSESGLDEIYRGKFSVIYPDNQKSRRMFYKNAKSYASIFGGKVIFDPKSK